MLAADDIHKKDPDFKLIYGCEAYFVDDMVPCVYGVKDQPLDGEFCVFDTETTGLDPGVEYLTEIGAVIIRNGEVVEEFDTFVKPGKPITPKITELTGITNEMVADAPSEKEALEAFFLPLRATAFWWDTTSTPLICAFCGQLPSAAASSWSLPILTP